MNWSIRWRLTLSNTLALAVLLAGFGGLVYAFAYRAALASLEARLNDCLDQLTRDPQTAYEPARLRYWIEEFWEHEQIGGVILDSQGRRIIRTEELPSDALPQKVEPVGDRPAFHSAVLPVLGRQRVLTASLPNGGDGSTVVLTASLAEVDRALAQLRTALFTAVPLMLAASAGLAYLLTARALGPMKLLAAATRRITADQLSERLAAANPHDELGQLTATINEMIARLERSFAEMRRFTADASHELRTPLAVIRTETEVALGKPLSVAEYQQLLGSILEECDRLTRLTEQLLALAREDARAARKADEPVDLTSLVCDVAEVLRPLAEAKRLRLHVEANGALPVRGDPSRLREVFFNLFDNAIKYTPDGGKVEARMGRQGEDAVVAVQDTGIGIPTEHLPHVFERFYRADKARSRAAGGTGLGLSIARSIVLAHGGEIELASTLGQGTTCTVRLPGEVKR